MLLVAHTGQHSGPLRSLAPRLAAMAAAGTTVTTVLPEQGPAERLAAEIGAVRLAGPGLLEMPRGPAGAARALAAIRAQRRVVAEIASSGACDLALLTSLRMPGAMLGARQAKAGVVVYCGEPLERRVVSRIVTRGLALGARRLAGAVLAPSEPRARRLGEMGLRSEVITPVIELPGLGPDLPERARALRASLDIPAGEPVIAALGSINRDRGQDRLLAAIAQWPGSGPRPTVLIGGEPLAVGADGEFARGLRDQLTSSGLAERVRLCGAVSDVAAFAAAADVFVNPARAQESFGRATCEALLAGTPVVLSGDAAASGFLEHERSALIVGRAAPRPLAAAIERLIGDPELAQRLVAAGREEVKRRCELPAGQARFEAALASALAAAG